MSDATAVSKLKAGDEIVVCMERRQPERRWGHSLFVDPETGLPVIEVVTTKTGQKAARRFALPGFAFWPFVDFGFYYRSDDMTWRVRRRPAMGRSHSEARRNPPEGEEWDYLH